MTQLAAVLSVPRRLLKALWRIVTAPFRWLRGRWEAIYHFFTDVPEDTPLTETFAETVGSRDSFLETLAAFGEHIEALRQHLFRSVVVLALAAGLCFWQATNIMAVMAAPLSDGASQAFAEIPTRTPQENLVRLLALGQQGIERMQVIEPTESVGVFMRVSLLAATVLAMPWFVTEMYLFIAPGLMPKSRVRLLLAIPLASLLFLVGVGFTYFVMLPVAIPFLRDFIAFRDAWRPSAYFGLITNLMFWVGVAFQMPLIIYTLALVGLLRTRQLVAQWRIAVVVIAIIAATITPTTDPVNMGLVMLPMILLYFVSIVGAWFAERGRRRSAA